MYVDKRLDDVMAVQTLSRLNRTFPGKTGTFVLDFRNKAEDILKAFEPYYRTAALSNITDRNLPHRLREKLDGAHVYPWEEVEAFAKLYFSNRKDQAFQAHLKQALERAKMLAKEEQDLFRRDAATYVVAYDFLSQLVDYDDPELEKLHAFLKMLLPRLRGQDPDPVLIDGSVRLAGYKLVNKQTHALDLEKGETRALDPLGAGGGEAQVDEKAKLSEIIKKIHSLFFGKHSDPEIAGWFTAVVGNTVADVKIIAQAKANPTLGQFANGDIKSVLAAVVIKALESHHSMSEQMLQDPKVFDDVFEVLLPVIYEQASAAMPNAA
jgi:type I restriction enzyme R subunit